MLFINSENSKPPPLQSLPLPCSYFIPLQLLLCIAVHLLRSLFSHFRVLILFLVIYANSAWWPGISWSSSGIVLFCGALYVLRTG